MFSETRSKWNIVTLFADFYECSKLKMTGKKKNYLSRPYCTGSERIAGS